MSFHVNLRKERRFLFEEAVCCLRGNHYCSPGFSLYGHVVRGIVIDCETNRPSNIGQSASFDANQLVEGVQGYVCAQSLDGLRGRLHRNHPRARDACGQNGV